MLEINEELKNIIESNALALASVDQKGNPHVIGVADVRVVSKNQILVGDNYMIQTIKNIQRNNKVALVVWSKDWKENFLGYELRGNTEYFTEGKWHEMIKKIHKGFPAKGAILITINKLRKIV